MKLKEFVGDCHHLDYDGGAPGPVIRVDSEHLAYVEFSDDMHFHRTHYASELIELGLYDEDGEWLGLNSTGALIMQKILAMESGVHEDLIDIDADSGGDEVILEYTMALPPEALEMDVDSEELFDLCWDFLATCVNVTDPGTFGSPYIITSAADVLSRYESEDNTSTIDGLIESGIRRY